MANLDWRGPTPWRQRESRKETPVGKGTVIGRGARELANLLCESNDAWQTLEDLERRDLFVQSLDRERVWYRYHRLFAEFLQERMRRRFDGLQVSLHRVATGWFQQQGFITEAIRHALDSRDAETVANLFESLGGWHHWGAVFGCFGGT